MVWMNEYSVVPKTLAASFEHLRCFYFFCLASDQEMAAHPERRAALWDTFTPEMKTAVTARMAPSYYLTGDRQKMLELNRLAPINTDHNPITEYYLGYNIKRYLGWM
jgi:hypothetical protein